MGIQGVPLSRIGISLQETDTDFKDYKTNKINVNGVFNLKTKIITLHRIGVKLLATLQIQSLE